MIMEPNDTPAVFGNQVTATAPAANRYSAVMIVLLPIQSNCLKIRTSHSRLVLQRVARSHTLHLHVESYLVRRAHARETTPDMIDLSGEANFVRVSLVTLRELL
jgi:hypothetical protein